MSMLRLATIWSDERGQDVVEYALLTAFIGVIGVAVWTAIQNSLSAMYQARDAATQNLWEPQAPGGGGT